MTKEYRPESIYGHLDRFQLMKQGRMKSLLAEIERMGKVDVNEFLSHIAVNYGIRRVTGQEYLRDWVDGKYITIEKGMIRVLKKTEGSS